MIWGRIGFSSLTVTSTRKKVQLFGVQRLGFSSLTGRTTRKKVHRDYGLLSLQRFRDQGLVLLLVGVLERRCKGTTAYYPYKAFENTRTRARAHTHTEALNPKPQTASAEGMRTLLAEKVSLVQFRLGQLLRQDMCSFLAEKFCLDQVKSVVRSVYFGLGQVGYLVRICAHFSLRSQFSLRNRSHTLT